MRPGFIEVEKEFMNMGNEDIIYGNQGQPSASSRMVLDSSGIQAYFLHNIEAASGTNRFLF